ncbi:MAG: Asp-tRNA(Asn)/Glu-tRNA(Gln) amidotransferase subunit GatA [Myxococcota bacterium]|nr:Asp-tRNA(Asn)/Glu-tRNA(Gln) amidotransferase subunit GatA [Myxococcota bacterium]
MRETASSLAESVRNKQRTAEEVISAVLDRLPTTRHLNAITHCDPEHALASARAIDKRIHEGLDPGPLAGVPVAIKDNFCDAGQPCSCGSRILEDYQAPYTASAVEKLRAAGAIVIARTNMDEFAMGSSNETSAFGCVSNPWDLDRVPGGSSGGSAAAVAANLVPIALGSSTGGSVRQPASFTGVVGLKPTYGRISRWGLVAYASSLDVVAPLGKTVEDTAIALQVMAGPDPQDSTSIDAPVDDFVRAARQGVAGLKIGILSDVDAAGNDPLVSQRVREGAALLEKAGATVQEVELPASSHAVACYYVLAPSEASSNLSRFDGIRYGPREPAKELDSLYTQVRSKRFGPEVQRRILMGTYCLSAGYYDAFYQKAREVQSLLRTQVNTLFETVDLLLLPTTPSTAFRKGEKTNNPLSMYLGDVYTVTANLTGIPGISVPCGLANGLPVGLQLMAPHLQEGRLLAAASVIEQSVGLLSPPA